jgi:acetylornithine deacetylase/succinyl-diaminopimelate desuccinylase-like protein
MKEAEEALERGFSARPCYIREGGSIPIVLTLKELLGIDTILMGFGLNDDNPHAPNEKFSLEDFEKGILTSAWFLHLCSQK